VDVLGILHDEGVINAVVPALKHESPYCVATAAIILGLAGRVEPYGQMSVITCGAIPALVRIIERSPPKGDVEKATGMFRR
jgi:hypothetical protein